MGEILKSNFQELRQKVMGIKEQIANQSTAQLDRLKGQMNDRRESIVRDFTTRVERGRQIIASKITKISSAAGKS